jgi:hypothetical protein
MLSNLIGVVLAFVTVMLLLSLIVMALVQLTQALLRLRGRNLIVGIEALLQAEGLAPVASQPKQSRLRHREPARHAATVLNATTAAKLRPVRSPNSLVDVVRGPATSTVDPKDLARAIIRNSQLAAAPPPPAAHQSVVGAAEPPPSPVENDLADKFRALEPAMSDRFARSMQILTAAWGLFVAVLFQVNSPALFKTLSTSEVKREAVIALVPSALKQAESSVPTMAENDFVDRALGELAQAYPQHKELFDQVSGSTDSREAMLQELRDVMAGVPNVDAVVARYAQIIDSNTTHDIRSATQAAMTAIDSLDSVDIRPWGQGGAFYMDATNIVGVLITAILLSFGAPFWFQQLKNVAGLRDALAKPKATS